MFYTFRDINLTINNKQIFCNSLNLVQDASLSHPYQEQDNISTENRIRAPIVTQFNIQYYLTGKCPLKDYTNTNFKYPLSGNMGGIIFNQGYLSRYSINGSPNSAVVVNATISVLDEISGSLSSITPQTPPDDLQVFNFNDSYFSNSSLNILNFQWEFNSDVKAIYYQRDTGVKHLQPDRVFIGAKEINASIVSDSQDFDLDITGQLYQLDFACQHPSLNITEIYSISGFINRKTFNLNEGDSSSMVYNISQNHTNYLPTISGIDISHFNGTGYIIIPSQNVTNGFFTDNENFSMIEKVIVGDREYNFTTIHGSSYDTILAYVPHDAINGDVLVQTTKGLLRYPTPVTELNFNQITVSGFYHETGRIRDIVHISGSNFNRITQVLFNNIPTNFQVNRNNPITGDGIHSLIATVPDYASVGKITVVSSLRNRSGSSTGIFYPEPYITGFYPITGIWSGLISIYGGNFSGITNLYFNNINSLAFNTVNQNLITGQIPGTGQGFTKGYITISGQKGLTAKSPYQYRPVVPIYNISAPSGTIEDELAVYTVIDTGFLCQKVFNNVTGYLIGFGNATGVFYPSGNSNSILTGLAPKGVYGNSKVSLFEPDNATKYPPYTGTFAQVGPAPEITSVSPTGLQRFDTYTLNLEGKYFKDFFGLPYYFALSGYNDGIFSTYSDITVTSLQDKVTVNNVVVTGETGLYDVYLINYAGSGYLKTGINITKPNNIAQLGSVTQYEDYNNDPLYFLVQPAGNATDSNLSSDTTYSRASSFNESSALQKSGYFTLTLDKAYNISIFQCYRRQVPSLFAGRRKFGEYRGWDIYADYGSFLTTGINVQFYDIGNTLVFQTGTEKLDFEISGNNFPDAGYESIATGVKQIIIYSSGDRNDYGVPIGAYYFLHHGINTLNVYASGVGV